MYKIKYLLHTLFLIVVFSVLSSAQPPDDGGGFPVDQDQIPLDGGVGFLIASGVAIGARKWYKNRQNN